MASIEELRAELDALRERVDRLLDLNSRLGDENQALRSLKVQLADERALLLSKNEQARGRIEAMISKLKALEAGA